MVDDIYKIDASGMKIGRVASEAALALTGKNSPSYQAHILSGVKVEVANASGMDVSKKKRAQTEHTRFTGYPSGLRISRLGDTIDTKGYGEAIRMAVRGMLPDNKLRNEMMKNLSISE